MKIINNIVDFCTGLPNGVRVQKLVLKASEEQWANISEQLRNLAAESGIDKDLFPEEINKAPLRYGWKFQSLFSPDGGELEIHYDKTLDK